MSKLKQPEEVLLKFRQGKNYEWEKILSEVSTVFDVSFITMEFRLGI